MKRLLRSVIDFGATSQERGLTQDNLLLNFQRIRESPLEWELPEDTAIYKFLGSYFQPNMEMPSIETVRDYFEKDTEVTERLKDIEAAQFYIRTNFAHLLKTLIEQQNQRKVTELLKEAHQIVTKGLTIKEGREEIQRRGVQDGIMHFVSKANDLIVLEGGSRQRGDIRKDGQEVWDEYLTAKLNKDKVWGRFTGIDRIDTICHGLKKKELHIHAAFAGELKSTFATNWCYNLVTRYRTNVMYATFEMGYEHIRRLIYVMHSSHPRWALEGYKALDYRKVRDGDLTPEEEIFYQKVIDDFTHNPDYCEFHTWAPDHDVDFDEARIEVELLHKQSEIGFTVLDHGGLMEARKKNRSKKDYTIELNTILRDAKKFALHFNHGEGMPTLLLFQINRTGKTEAEKNDGIYKNLQALSYSNEAERSADVVTATYLSQELRAQGQTKFSCLKNRDNPLFEPFLAEVDFTCRRMRNLDLYNSAPGMGVQDETDLLNNV
jgi:replicative DNA helicase